MEELKRLGKDSAFLNLYNREEYEKALHEELKEAEEKGIEQKKEDVIILYQNGASKELICKSLNISVEKMNGYLNGI